MTAFVPEMGAFAVIAGVRTRAVRTAELVSESFALVRFMDVCASTAARLASFAVTTLMPESLAVETSDWLLFGFSRDNMSVEDGRTFAKHLVRRSGGAVVYSQRRDFLLRLSVFGGLDPFGFEDRERFQVVVNLVLSQLVFVLRVEEYRDELEDDLVGSVFDACARAEVGEEPLSG